MKHQIDSVKKFHEVYKLGYKNSPSVDLDHDKLQLRHNLMKEENEEYLQAAKENDLVEIGDALGDMLYILCGTIIEHGMQNKIEEILMKFKKVI